MEELGRCDIDAITSLDVVILVMGITGSGKSTFISELVKEDVQVGHDLSSCSSGVNFFALEYQQGRRLFLVDTPGFSDTYQSDGEVLKDIAFILAQLHRTQVPIAGIVYLHRITDNRLSGTAARSLKILAKMCGENAYNRVVLVTSMWDTVRLPGDNADFLSAIRRENQLRQADAAWQGLCSQGSLSLRWTRSSDGHSSMAVIDALMDIHLQHGSFDMRIQVELVEEGKQLHETEAGKIVDEELSQAKMELQQEAETLKARYREAIADKDNSMSQELLQQAELSTRGMERLESSQKEIKIGMAKLAQEMQANYRTILSHLLREQFKTQELIAACEADYQYLKDQETHNLEVLRGSQQQYAVDRRRLSEREAASLDEEQSELEAQFQEEQGLNEKRRIEFEKKIKKQKRKKLMKTNVVPLLQILAGVGTTVGGGFLMNPAMMAPGVEAVLSGISQLKFSTKDLSGR